MSILSPEWSARLDHWIRTLKEDLYRPLGELHWEAAFTRDMLSAEEALKKDFIPVTPGFAWGREWEYGWFVTTVTLPEEAEGERIVLDPGLDCECTLFVDGREFGTYRSAWVTEKHHFLTDNALTESGKAGHTFSVLAEAYAGHWLPYLPQVGHTCTGPVLPGTFEHPDPEAPRKTVGRGTFGIWNEDAYQLLMDAETLRGVLDAVDPASLRADRVAEALRKFTLAVDFEQGYEERRADYRRARQVLAPALAARNGSTVPEFFAVGHAHLDLAWLWPLAETVRKTARTFAAQLRLMEEYPEYRFLQSSPAAYEMLREHYPELFRKTVEAAKSGHLIPEGACYVEPDTNLTSGESLVRQILYGKKYYKEVFGIDSTVLWIPDTFGYTAALPQICVKTGVKYLVTQKIFWSYNTDGEGFPYHYFRWEGMDGSRITTFLPTDYNYRTNARDVARVWKERRPTEGLETFLYPFGYGDGGAGPCRDHIELARRLEDLEGIPKVRFAGPEEFFGESEKRGGPRETYRGELYFTAHRGTLTSQARMKARNRRAEFAMQRFELWGALAALAGGPDVSSRAEALWKTVLLHQFHDILPGSCIGKVYEDADRTFGKWNAEAAEGTAQSLRRLLDPDSLDIRSGSPEERGERTVFNPLGFARRCWISLPEGWNGAFSRRETFPVLPSAEGLMALVTVPAFGSVTIGDIPGYRWKADTHGIEEARLSRTGEGFVLENGLVKAAVSRRGEVTSFILKETGREFAAGPMNRLHLYKDVPRYYDAWDVDSNYREQEVEDAVHAESAVPVFEEGAAAELLVTGVIGKSPYRQRIRLEAESRRLEFVTEVEWAETHRLLKAGFPVDVYADEAIHEMQFGYVRRPVHRSRPYDKDRFETANHRYTALADGSHGAAVLNDGKYGVSVNENEIGLSLLRAPSSPDPAADRGHQAFSYAFTAWEGPFGASGVVREGYGFNVRPFVSVGRRDDFSLFSCSRDNIVAETVKPASDGSGDLVVRLYESMGEDTEAQVKFDLSAFGKKVLRIRSCSLLEEPEEEGENPEKSRVRKDLHFGPFEIRTLRITAGD